MQRSFVLSKKVCTEMAPSSEGAKLWKSLFVEAGAYD